jgi:hypothetical protein
VIIAHVLLWLTTAALILNTLRRLRGPIDVALFVPVGWLVLIPLPIIIRGDSLGFAGAPRINLEIATSIANVTFIALQFFLSSGLYARLSAAVTSWFDSPSPLWGGSGRGSSKPPSPLAGESRENFPPPLAGAGPSAHASGALVSSERLRRSGQGGGLRRARRWVLALAIVVTALAFFHWALMPKIPLLEVIRGMTDPHQLALDRENSAKLLLAPALLKYVFTWNSRLLFPLVLAAAVLLRWWRLAIPIAILGLLYIMSPLEKFPSMLFILSPFLAIAVRERKRIYSPIVIGGLLVSLLGPLLVLQSTAISNSAHRLLHIPQPTVAATGQSGNGAPAAGSGYSIDAAVRGLTDLVLRRIGTGPADVSYEWFAYFPDAHHGFLNGSGWAPWEVLSSHRESPANMVGRWAFYGKAHYDISSISAYASFIADGWAEFGYIGVVLGCLVLFALAVVIELTRAFIRDPLCLACYVPALLLLTSTVPIGGLLAILFSLGIVLSPLICLAYLLTGRRTPRRDAALAARLNQATSQMA